MLRDVFITNFEFNADGFDAVTGLPVSIVATYTDGVVERYDYSKASGEVCTRICEQHSVYEMAKKISPLSPWARKYLANVL